MGKHSARASHASPRPAAPAAGGPAGDVAGSTGEEAGPLGGPGSAFGAEFGPAFGADFVTEAGAAPGTGRRRASAAEEAAGPEAVEPPPPGSWPDPLFDPEWPGAAAGRDGRPGEHQPEPGVGWGVIGVQRGQAAGPAGGYEHHTYGSLYVTDHPAGPDAAHQPVLPFVDEVFPPVPAPAAASAPGSVFTPAPAPAAAPAEGPSAGGDGTPRVTIARPGSRRAPRGTGPFRTGQGLARTATGVAAALVTAVLAVIVAGQVEEGADSKAQARSADVERTGPDAASRSDSRPTPNGGAVVPATYEQKMAKKYPLAPDARGTGDFETVGGHDKAPGKGEVLRYRVDVEKGLPLDGGLFATAVQRTLNDERSWGHGGDRTFERVSTGSADFVITLASPGTTATWCAKSGLDTTQDNVSCDSAATDRVMINAYRWAQGAQTYGDRMHAYRQMLINHEVGHRLGHDHETCAKEGALAPVMMQQTKFLTTDGATCRPNPWPFPGE
ncbi:DUF3152 domain-containing protein [Streptomyces sp. HU2014]|uniref:DUF3152 domain-containing protein n=1 Tax=Streptomyces sp. HU2014 TaxID=2939414 RepID=UPI00200D515E|nr:DUF3152 domain-containing protein [Streptomyces sp. HU2014]UQI48032.1 DUF3152 domain-containing protein [Streptomyces sp. HU2014]